MAASRRQDEIIWRWTTRPWLWYKMGRYAFALGYGMSAARVRAMYLKDRDKINEILSRRVS